MKKKSMKKNLFLALLSLVIVLNISFSFELTKLHAAIVPNGTYMLVSALNSSYVWDIAGASADNGGNLQLYKKNNTNAQRFVFKKKSDGYYTIENVSSGKMVDCNGAGRSNGTNIQQFENNEKISNL